MLRAFVVIVLAATPVMTWAQAKATPKRVPPPLSAAARGQKTFSGPGNAYEFDTPADFRVCSGEDFNRCRVVSFLPPCDDDAEVCALYPPEALFDTQIEAAGVQVRQVGGVRSADECVTPRQYEYLISAESPVERAGDALFVHGVGSAAATGHASSDDYLRAYRQKTCYEIRLRIAKSTKKNQESKPIDEKVVRDALWQVARTFRFK